MSAISAIRKPFSRGANRYYAQTVDDALAEIDRLPGRHLYFLDDHLLGNQRFATALFDGMRGMGRLWQAAGTVQSVLRSGLLEKAVDAGLRSLFVGFETLNPDNLRAQHKYQNLNRDYTAAIRRLHDLGVMVNGSFVFGMDDDDESRLRPHRGVGHRAGHRDRHLPHPDPLSRHGAPRAHASRRIASRRTIGTCTTRAMSSIARPSSRRKRWRPGYWRAYRDFYRWGSIFQSAATKPSVRGKLRHVAYAGGWKKFEPMWDLVIRAGRVSRMLPVLEAVLSGFGDIGRISSESAPADTTSPLIFPNKRTARLGDPR